MRTVISLVLILAVQPYIAQTKQATADRRAIEALATNFQDGWNRHDVEQLASLVAEDVDYVTVVGTKGWEKGRTEFKNRHAAVHKTMFKESVLTVKETHIRFVRSDLVIAHVLWETKGDVIPGRKSGEPRAGIFTWVLEKRAGRWLIIASQNTDDKQLPTVSEAR